MSNAYEMANSTDFTDKKADEKADKALIHLQQNTLTQMEEELKDTRMEFENAQNHIYDLKLSLNHIKTKADTWRAAFCVGVLAVVVVGIYVVGKIL